MSHQKRVLSETDVTISLLLSLIAAGVVLGMDLYCLPFLAGGGWGSVSCVAFILLSAATVAASLYYSYRAWSRLQRLRRD